MPNKLIGSLITIGTAIVGIISQIEKIEITEDCDTKGNRKKRKVDITAKNN